MAGTFDKTYTGVTWTEGDVATETKMDNMVNNDQAHDAYAAQGLTFNNTVEVKGKDSGGTARDLIKIDSSNDIQVGKQNEAGHTVINAGTSKLVKLKVLRQDDTTNTYTANSVILTGWGYITGDGGSRALAESVVFGITFSVAPVIIISTAGIRDGSNPSDITGNNSYSQEWAASSYYNGLTAFTAVIQRSSDDGGDPGPLGATIRYIYNWIAVGQLN